MFSRGSTYTFHIRAEIVLCVVYRQYMLLSIIASSSMINRVSVNSVSADYS